MDGFTLVRMMGALLFVLGLMVCALMVARRYNLAPGATGRRGLRRMEVVERLSLDPKRSAVLLRLDDKEHLIVLSPEGVLNVASVDHVGRQVEESVGKDDVAAPREGVSFASLIGEAARQAKIIKTDRKVGA